MALAKITGSFGVLDNKGSPPMYPIQYNPYNRDSQGKSPQFLKTLFTELKSLQVKVFFLLSFVFLRYYYYCY